MDSETIQSDSKDTDIILPAEAVPATYADVHAAVTQAVGSNPSERALRGSVLRVLAEQTALSVPDVLELQVTMDLDDHKGSVDERIDRAISTALETVKEW
ncbi:hypothetical protein ACOZ4N_01360 (plasmid) [Halorientalis pallida]|uniref:hypothetical protein n=1 Tax=Halorientalis pallida TaxID=2479928 RepID=UPI003C6F851F